MKRIKYWGAIIAAILGLIAVYITGRRGGYKKGRSEGLDREEELINEAADKELEAKRDQPIVDRINGARDRILQRRGGGS